MKTNTRISNSQFNLEENSHHACFIPHCENYLLDQASDGNAEALFQIGLRAVNAGRLGFAREFFRMALQAKHPLAETLLSASSFWRGSGEVA